VPLVQLGLQAVALGQQGGVLGRQVGHDGVKAFPEVFGAHAGAGQDLVLMNWYRSVETCRPWIWVRCVMNGLRRLRRLKTVG
jgi:hypothetical protein